jgi:hypothetical protein
MDKFAMMPILTELFSAMSHDLLVLASTNSAEATMSVLGIK